MATRRHVLFLGFLLAAVGVTGCAHVGIGAEAPTVATRGVSLQSASPTGVRGTVHLNVFNPNAFAVPLRRARFAIDIGGAELASGDIDLPVTIPAKASSLVDASIVVDGFSAATAAARYGAGERGYRLSGTLHFATRLGTLEVEVAHEGEIGDLIDATTNAGAATAR